MFVLLSDITGKGLAIKVLETFSSLSIDTKCLRVDTNVLMFKPQ